MSRKQNLQYLRDKVKAGTLNNWLDMKRAVGIRPDNRHFHGMKAYNGSLDAAKALHDAVLPLRSGWRIQTFIMDGRVHIRKGYRFSDLMHAKGYSPHNPARAWLLAILEALIAQEPDT